MFDRFSRAHTRAQRTLPMVAALRQAHADLSPALRTPDGLRRGLAALRATLRAEIAPLETAWHAAQAVLAAAPPDAETDARTAAEAADRALWTALAAANATHLVPVYTLVLEACRQLEGTSYTVLGESQVWHLQPYDVQLQAAILLAERTVAEIATGEGKTLIAAFPLVLRALAGFGTHLVTANAYLAQRDAAWMGALYTHLGLTVGCVDGTPPASDARRSAYAQDITYGTIAEFGFDYLRDHLAPTAPEQVQRDLVSVLVDEADAVLLDTARIPVIISGPTHSNVLERYQAVAPAVRALVAAQAERLDHLTVAATAALAAGNLEVAGPLLGSLHRGGPRHPALQHLLATDPAAPSLLSAVLTEGETRRTLQTLDVPLLYTMDLEGAAVALTEAGMQALAPNDPALFVLEDETAPLVEDLESSEARDARWLVRDITLSAVQNLLRAQVLLQRDVDYVVTHDQVQIVDQTTGRTMDGRRWSNNLHLAVEIVEGVPTVGETQTQASISIMQYCRKYVTLSGMTGTAVAAANEFANLYGLAVAVVPSHRPCQREDRPDLLYREATQKWAALTDEIDRLHRLQLPVLVGTASVEESEVVSTLLTARGLPHQVLNARRDQAEAALIAHAGQTGAITVATNMAGRGTDIVLAPETLPPRTVAWCTAHGVDLAALPRRADPTRRSTPATWTAETVLEIGGLHVLATTRHESRRVDQQLRGRAGRQGDVGVAQALVSLEDAFLREWQSDRMFGLLDTLTGAATDPLVGRPITAILDKAQALVNDAMAAGRARVAGYDKVLDAQREIVYALRTLAVDGHALAARDAEERADAGLTRLCTFVLRDAVTRERLGTLAGYLTERHIVPHLALPGDLLDRPSAEAVPLVRDAVLVACHQARAAWRAATPPDQVTPLLAADLLAALDASWQDHLAALDRLRDSVIWRGVAQQDPLEIFTHEAFKSFEEMLERLDQNVLARLGQRWFPPTASAPASVTASATA